MKRTFALILILLALAPVFAQDPSPWDKTDASLEIYGVLRINKDGSSEMVEWNASVLLDHYFDIAGKSVYTKCNLGWNGYFEDRRYNYFYCYAQASFTPDNPAVNSVWLTAEVDTPIEDGRLVPPTAFVESQLVFTDSGYSVYPRARFTFSFDDMEKGSGLTLGGQASIYNPVLEIGSLYANVSTMMLIVDGGLKFADTLVNASLYHYHDSGVNTSVQLDFEYSYDLGPERNGLYIYAMASDSTNFNLETRFSFHLDEKPFQLNYASMTFHKYTSSDYINMQLYYYDYDYDRDKFLQWSVEARANATESASITLNSTFNVFFREDGPKYKEYIFLYINDTNVFTKDEYNLHGYSGVCLVPFNTYDDESLLFLWENYLSKDRTSSI